MLRRVRGAGVVVAVLSTLLLLGGHRADATPDLAELLGLVVQHVDVGSLLPGESATIEGAADAVVLSWVGAPDRSVGVRRLGPEGWGEWVEAHAVPEEAPDAGAEGVPGGRTVVGPVWTGSGTGAIEVRGEEGALGDLQVDLLQPADEIVDDPVGAVTGLVDQVLRPPVPPPGPSPAPARPRPNIYPTSAWGSPGWSYDTPGCEAGPRTAPLQVAIVHHTVQANGYSPDQVPALIRSVYYAHRARGWCDIGYNFMVDGYGQMWQARSGPMDAAVVGGHARGHNTGSIGIALIGQYHPGASPPAGAPTDASVSSVADVAAWQFRIHGTAPHVVGHRDVGATACPGDYVYARMDEIRATTAART